MFETILEIIAVTSGATLMISAGKSMLTPLNSEANKSRVERLNYIAIFSGGIFVLTSFLLGVTN